MRKMILLLAAMAAVVFALSLGGSSARASALIPCFGAGTDPGYLAAFDSADGTTDGAVSYPEPRFYMEEQTWVTPVGSFPGHHSEHVHFGACIPNAQTITTTFRMDLGYTFHNMQDYTVTAASESAVNQAGSKSLWTAPAATITALNNAAQASCPTCQNNVQKVYFSATSSAPTVNGLKEIRGGLSVVAANSAALFLTWNTDARWYETDNFAGLSSSSPLPNQLDLRVRPIMGFNKPASSGGGATTDYHHSGYSGMTPQDTTQCGSVLTGTTSAVWDEAFVSPAWSGDKTVCLYVTDGGGPATLMIDPDFHHHYTTPTTDCPNVDQFGNCLGKWFWQPNNPRKEIFSGAGSPQNIPVTIPGSVLAGLAPGLHKLVFKSDDFPECFRNSGATQDWHLCPSDVRATWSNVTVLPFVVGDTEAPSQPTALSKSNPQPSSIDVSWTASTDNNAVAGYRVYLDGTQVADVSNTSVTVSGLSAPSHTVEVEAYDAAGNSSSRASVTVTRSWQ